MQEVDPCIAGMQETGNSPITGESLAIEDLVQIKSDQVRAQAGEGAISLALSMQSVLHIAPLNTKEAARK